MASVTIEYWTRTNGTCLKIEITKNNLSAAMAELGASLQIFPIDNSCPD